MNGSDSRQAVRYNKKQWLLRNESEMSDL